MDCVGKLNLFLMEKHSPFFLSQENRHHSWQLFAGSCSWYRSQSNGGTSVAISVILQTNVWTHGNHTIISSYFKIIFYKMLVISAKSGGGGIAYAAEKYDRDLLFILFLSFNFIPWKMFKIAYCSYFGSCLVWICYVGSHFVGNKVEMGLNATNQSETRSKIWAICVF